MKYLGTKTDSASIVPKEDLLASQVTTLVDGAASSVLPSTSSQLSFSSLLQTIRNNLKWILTNKQDTLISGNNIKTINSLPILGSGNLDVQPYKTGDIAYSYNASNFSSAEYLPCDGAELTDANAPSSIRPYLTRGRGTNFASAGSSQSMGAAPAGIYDMYEQYVLCKMTAAPYIYPIVRNAVGYRYLRESLIAPPTTATTCGAIGIQGSLPALLTFSAAAGSAVYAKRTSSTWSSSEVASKFTGKVVNGVVFGADGLFYILSTTAPYFYSIDPPFGSLVDIGGVGRSPVGLAISSNKKYIVSWHSVAPFIYVFEYDNGTYRMIGSPPIGAASFSRVEVSDNGVIVAKPSSGSNFYVCSVEPNGISSMIISVVDAATAWGISPCGRFIVTWVSNNCRTYKVQNNSISNPSPLSIYSVGTFGTLTGRFGLDKTDFVASSSIANTGYLLAGNIPDDGWIAPKIKNGFLKI